MANSTCHARRADAVGPPLFQNGELTFQAHHVGWIVSGFFALVATGVSIWLINKHLMWYTNKRHQRQLVRLLFMVPIYAIISCLAYFFWEQALPLTLIRDAYESVILAAFFYLLLEYIAPSPALQREYFRKVELDKWMFPFGWVKYRPSDGLYFLQLMKWGILQYCVLRPLCTLIALGLDLMGLYCEISWSPGWGHVYIVIIESISVSVAMYCLIQLYMPISKDLAPYKPLLKLFAIKAIIFLMFWQTTFLSVLSMFGVVKDTKYMTADEINIGIAAIVQTFEMVLFAFLHVNCFSYKPYRKTDESLQTPRWKSLRHAMDFRDTWRETQAGSVYMWRKARGKEPDPEDKRFTHLERAMGRSRQRGQFGKVTEQKEIDGLPQEEDDPFIGNIRRSSPRPWAPTDRPSRESSPRIRPNEARYERVAFAEPAEEDRAEGGNGWWRRNYNYLPPSDSHHEQRSNPGLYDLNDLPPMSSLPRSFLNQGGRFSQAPRPNEVPPLPPSQLLRPAPTETRRGPNQATKHTSSSPARSAASPPSKLAATPPGLAGSPPGKYIASPESSRPLPNTSPSGLQRSDSLFGRVFNDPVEVLSSADGMSASVHGPLVALVQDQNPPEPRARSPSPPPPPPKQIPRKRSLSPIASIASSMPAAPITVSIPAPHQPQGMLPPGAFRPPEPDPLQPTNSGESTSKYEPIAAPSDLRPRASVAASSTTRRASGGRRPPGPLRPQPVMPTPLSPARYGGDRTIVPGVKSTLRPLPGDLRPAPAPQPPRPAPVSQPPRPVPASQPPRPMQFNQDSRPREQFAGVVIPSQHRRQTGGLDMPTPVIPGPRSDEKVQAWRQSVVQTRPDPEPYRSRGRRESAPLQPSANRRMPEPMRPPASRRMPEPQQQRSSRRVSAPLEPNYNAFPQPTPYDQQQSRSRRVSAPLRPIVNPPSPALASPPSGYFTEAISSLGEHSRYPAVNASNPLTNLTTLTSPLATSPTTIPSSASLSQRPRERPW